VVDPVGGKVLQGSIACLGPRGRAISVGSAGRDPQLLDISDLAPANRSLTGVFFGAEIGTDRVQRLVGDLVDDVAGGRLRVIVDRTFPLSEAAAAHAYIESRRAVGRVVLIP
jgi:NADPH2:quinone reductase